VVVLSVLTTVLTTLRSWPQFVRIVTTGERLGVSPLTWALALASHTGWIAYGFASGLPLLVLTNLVAALGCGATTWVLRSARVAAGVAVAAGALAVAVAAVSDSVLLALVTTAALVMFVPQLVRTLREPSVGVSPWAWAISASASAAWLAYAWVIGRPSIVVAHYVMLPTSLLILVRCRISRPRPPPPLSRAAPRP
jgi:uncharacterized protein with PQ loop repeat